ncbi:MAG: NAD+ synthase [Parachlamydiaceae bacterium]
MRRLLAIQMNPTIADIRGNTKKIISGIQKAQRENCHLVVFPELALTGYPPEDFLLLPEFILAVETALEAIIEATEGITAVVGTVRRNDTGREKPLFNSAAIIKNKQLLGYQDKSLLPTYDVFDERRYFEPAHDTKIWTIDQYHIAITICEDLWQQSMALKNEMYTKDPLQAFEGKQVDLLLNLSASPFHLGKFYDRLKVCSRAAKTLQCPVILTNQIGGNDSLVFDGHSLYVSSQGQLLDMAKGFCEDQLLVDLQQTPTAISYHPDEMANLYQALVLGLRDYFTKSGFSKACLGLSGGIDSALVACLAVEALGPENVLAVLMPSRFSSKDSIEDASVLADHLQIKTSCIPIEGPFSAYLELLEPHFENRAYDVAEENIQARIRGMILMALSNKLCYIVLSTGNKSELAMGYSTLYGDMCGGLGVINDVSKTQVYALAKWINRDKEVIPQNTINKAPSAELRPNQKDSDTLPDYTIIDNVLKEYLENYLSAQEIAKKHGYDLALVENLIIKIHHNEYKRRQSPPGLRVTEKAFSVGRRFPIVQKWV